MKAITIHQPYPHLILTGRKPVENRSWYTHYRGRLAIHAGKSRASVSPKDYPLAEKDGFPLVFSAIVGFCDLVDCLHIDDIMSGKYDKKYPQLRGRRECYGPWCWVLASPRRLVSPKPYKGRQGLFNVPDELLLLENFYPPQNEVRQ